MVGFVFDVTPLTHYNGGDSDVGEFNEARSTTSAPRWDNPTTKTRFRSLERELWMGCDAVWEKAKNRYNSKEKYPSTIERSSECQGTFSSGESFECFAWWREGVWMVRNTSVDSQLKKVEKRQRWWEKLWRNKIGKEKTWTKSCSILDAFQFIGGVASTWWVSLVVLSCCLPTSQRCFSRRSRLFRARASCRHQFEPHNFFSLIFSGFRQTMVLGAHVRNAKKRDSSEHRCRRGCVSYQGKKISIVSE